jgi:glycerophosphoryl diester phosphodiesterase
MKIVPLLPDRDRPLLFAHRGCSSLAPENTMAAFTLARDLGSPGLELDIHPCAGGELVVVHDDTFVRTAPEYNGGGRRVEELSLKEIRGIEVGAFFGPAFRGEYPPLLEEVVETFCPAMYIDIELKTGKIKDDPLPALAAEKLRSFGRRIMGSLTVSSFNPFALAAFKGLCPEIPTAIIWCVDPGLPFALRRGFGRFISRCDYLKPRHTELGRLSLLRLGIPPGRPLIPWTVDTPEAAARMLALGCPGIITNRPQDMGAFLLPGKEMREKA